MTYSTGYQGTPNAWRGVIKQDGRPVWVSLSVHWNRDQSGRRNVSAQGAARREIHRWNLAQDGLALTIEGKLRPIDAAEVARQGTPWE